MMLLPLSLCMVSGVFLSISVGPLGPFIARDLHVSRVGLGVLVAVFNIAAGLASPFMGRSTDMLGARRMAVRSSLLASLAAAGVAFAASFPILVGVFALGGLALAGANPSTNSAVAQSYPRRSRGLVLGIKQAAVPAASLLAGLLVPLMAVTIGWRSTMLVPIALGLTGALFSARYFPRHASSIESPVAKSTPPGSKALSLYAFLMGGATSCYTTYLGLFMQEDLNYPPSLIGLSFVLAGGFGVLSRVCWGWATDAFFHGRNHIVLGAAAAGGILAAAAAGMADGVAAGFIWITVVIYGIFLFGWGAALAVAVLENFAERVGQATGVVILGFYSGLAVSPPVFGWLVDTSGGRYGPGWALSGALASLALVLSSTLLRRTSVHRDEDAETGAVRPAHVHD